MAAEPGFPEVTLDGRHVRLEPLAPSHLAPLTAAAHDPAIFQYFAVGVNGAAGMQAFFSEAFDHRDRGHACPFAIVGKPGDHPIGSTRFGAIDRKHRRAEIGWTWLAPGWQRTGVNTEMKYLMLRHAFESLGLLRVEFKTDSLNEKSRRALTRIGATEEGTFRNHMVVQGGRVRHSVWFSVTDGDWPVVKQRLEGLMAAPPGVRAA
ncbi:MAG TPA: GNAT family protein [Steroidobacteraceae bacterium]|nr:GNAT family protein [Steroidobacteraceae bacterium]